MRMCAVTCRVEIALNYTSYFNALSDIFLGLKPYCPRYEEYQALFPTSVRLQGALCNFHAAIIQCCRHVVQALHRSCSFPPPFSCGVAPLIEFQGKSKSV